MKTETGGQADALEQEGSVPVSGFSRELRGADDVERYRFDFALRGEARWPVHIVYSASHAAAEIKTGDMKAVRFEGVASAEDARARWIAWWKAGRGKASFIPPRRIGRVPAALARA